MTETAVITDIADLLKDFPDPDAMILAEEKRKWGCVIRAFQSALGAQATPEEWDFRLDAIRRAKPSVSIETLDGYMDERKKDQANIAELLRYISVSATPLGIAARKFIPEQRALAGSAIKLGLKSGQNIVYATDNHMAHIQYDAADGSVRSRSDEGHPVVRLQNNKMYDTIIFTPRSVALEKRAFERRIAGIR